ncbi:MULTISPECIES: enoyl-CoA hydratase/isomerase family protein [Mycobacterium]|uniref:Enoyl-CoA hydratase n=4 Tax=Mycobacterium TaxID=1763 RepID=A0A9N7QME3_9MYCO|nr:MULTISPECIES: enoyl-CoA hydratase/isomerase family protein [Mycobacterium]AGC60715.1 enoyl-CoA hydratase, EchA8_1 [Mycobacterium liflandii 128FXT]EPQ49658.1 Enoyl-CoA hydratase [Mycobacterium sp. 012931]EPQ71411.1 Enoyl-CoA hydratase [Mycobacterium marinum MB2]MBC9865660.1 Enoyl-CoA hydratase [Mycobacterium pseudoshottsii]MDC8993732.1 enoyl-CoA hydratase/isomerase family protein [Mycobacterium marinum]
MHQDFRLLRVVSADGICRATIDHPPVNLLDVDLLTEIEILTNQVAADNEVRVLIVDSADPEFFIAHADVSLISDLPADDTARHDELSRFNAAMQALRGLPKATIAVIEGACRGGGCEFAMAFDMRYAALGTTVLGHPEVSVGIIPGGGGTQRLPHLVGRARALEVILGCRDIDAATAQAWGYVNRALPGEELWRFVDKLAGRIASYPEEAIAAAKRAVDVALDPRTDLTTGLRIEDQLLRETLALPDTRRRLQAVIEAGAQTREFELGAAPKPPAT